MEEDSREEVMRKKTASVIAGLACVVAVSLNSSQGYAMELWNNYPTSTTESTATITLQQQEETETLTLEQMKEKFDAVYYYYKYPDIANVFGMDEEKLWAHYEEHGYAEGRRCYLAEGESMESVKEAFQQAQVKAQEKEQEAEDTAQQNSGVEVVQIQESVATPVNGTVIGSCTTKYTAGIPRETNLKVASSRINGTVIQPEDTFSYSKTVLPRTSENGYVKATVIQGGKYVQGMGGGICQVSSTLYAAMLNANLPATERYPHSIPVTYLPKGYDATISGNSKDLKFKNVFDYPVQILANCDAGVLTVTLVLQNL